MTHPRDLQDIESLHYLAELSQQPLDVQLDVMERFVRFAGHWLDYPALRRWAGGEMSPSSPATTDEKGGASGCVQGSGPGVGSSPAPSLHPNEKGGVEVTRGREGFDALRPGTETTSPCRTNPAPSLHPNGDGDVVGTHWENHGSLPPPKGEGYTASHGEPGSTTLDEPVSLPASTAGSNPARRHHCIGLCDPDRRGPWDSMQEYYDCEVW